MSTRIPGPWISQGPYIKERDDRGATVATVHTGNASDAKLLTAAPVLAERLLDIIQAYESGSASALQVWIEDSRALLAKAGVL